MGGGGGDDRGKGKSIFQRMTFSATYELNWGDDGVMICTSAFLACHQC